MANQIVSQQEDKGLSCQSYGFSSSLVWMWPFDHKEGWGPKNWCFWTVVLEKALESPLDWTEIKPVHPKGDQSWLFIRRTDVEAEAPALVLPMNIQDWFPLGWTDWISLQSMGLLRVFSNTTIQKHQFFGPQPSLWSISHIHTWLSEKPYLCPDGPLLTKWCLCFLIRYLGWSQLVFQGASSFLISWLQSKWFWAQENKICHYFLFSPTYLQWNDGTRCHDLCFLILVFWMLSFKPVFFHFLLSSSSRGSFSFLVSIHTIFSKKRKSINPKRLHATWFNLFYILK